MFRHRVKVWAVAAGMVLATLPASSQSPALRVVSAGPTGELTQLADANDVRIVFSEPMVALGTVPPGTTPSWIEITPAVRGSFYWSGTKTLMFSPDESAPLPNATKFTVRVDAGATSAAGRALSAPHEFTFTTPTVRLQGVDWYRKGGRHDGVAVLRLRFNQRVRPEDAAAHTHLALMPHEWAPPVMSVAARDYLQRTDPAGLARFDDKVAAVQRVVSSTDPLGVRVADNWDEQRFPRATNIVVLESTTAPPPQSWLKVTLDARLPSPDGPETHAEQSSVVQLEPALFVGKPACTADCDPNGYGAVPLTRETTLGALRRHVSVHDVTDPASEQAVTPDRDLTPEVTARQASYVRAPELGYQSQPPARSWRIRIDGGLEASDGQMLGYSWVEVIRNVHQWPSLSVSAGVWEASGGSQIPLYVRNVVTGSQWTAPVAPADVMPRLRALQVLTPRQSPPLPPSASEPRRFTLTPDVQIAHALDLRRVLPAHGRGVVWAATAPESVLPNSAPVPTYVNRVNTGLVQVTNLGISVKDSPQSTLIFVTALDTGVALPGAAVSIVDTSNRTRWSGTTDRDGVAIAPALPLRDPSRPYDLSFVVTAEKDDDFAFVASTWNEHPWAFNLNYDISERTAGLRGSVFTDRGVYKTSEDVHVKAIVRDDTSAGVQMVRDGAVEVLVSDPRGREVDRRTVTLGRWSSAEWTWRVPANGALGHYQVRIGRPGAFTSNRYWPGVSGNFLVAAYRRPDFRVDAALTAEPEVLGSTLRGVIEAKYLFGGALGARPVRVWSRREIVQAPPKSVRERYPEAGYAVGYQPRPDERRYEGYKPPTNEKLGADGRVSVSVPTAAEGDLAYSYTVEGDVEDVSGQRLANRASLVVHPAGIYVAVSRPPMFVDSKTGLTTRVAVTDLRGQAVAGTNVTLALFREHWIYRPPTSERLSFGSLWERREIPAGEWTIASASAETPVTIPVREGGGYVLRATARDATGRSTRTEATFYALGPGVSSWRAEGRRIELTPERKTWAPGESARILVQSPWERATALVTVEREGIRHHHTVAITSMQDTVSVPITEADVPNVYVSVLLVKGRTSTEYTPETGDAGRPAYRLGYTELTVDDASRRLRVAVSADKDEYRPRQPVKVSVAVTKPDGTPAPGEVTLWAMDYGLLSLTGYQAPDVVKAIYTSKALQVMTADNRQALISRRPLIADASGVAQGQGLAQSVMLGALTEVVDARASTVAGLPAAMAPPPPQPGVEIRSDFRPLVFWLGSATADATGRVTTTVTLPDSLTTYRIIAVAGDDQSHFGVGEKEIRVAKPLTLLPAFPRFLSSGDRASFGAVVTNNGKDAGAAVVTIQSLDPRTLQFGTASRQTVRLAPGASESVKFDAVARASGTARVRMIVTLGAEADAFDMPLVVTAPIRAETTAAYGDTIDRAIERLALPPGVVPSAGGLSVELASTALVGLGEGARYITEYPYECAEQKASRALALLLASDLGAAFRLNGVTPDQYKSEAAAALRSLYGYQCGSGGFALWPGGCGNGSPYLTAYVLHVLKVGEDLQVPADPNSVSRALDYLQQHLRQPPPEVQWWPAWAASQAYAVKVLAERGRRPVADVNRLAGLAERLPVFAMSYVADALKATGNTGAVYQSVVQRIGNALRIEADRAHVEEVDDAALAWLWNSNPRATAAVLEGFSRRFDDRTFVAPLVRWLLASRTNGRWGTTYENATALEALVSYYRAFESDVPAMTATVRVGSSTLGSAPFNGRSTTARELQLSMADLLKQLSGSGAPTLTISRTGTGRLYYTARVRTFAPESPAAVDRGFKVERRHEPYRADGTSPASSTFNAGDLVRVTVTLTLRGEGRYLALTDPIPAGFEPLEGWFKTTASDLAQQATRTTTGGDWLAMWRRGSFDHVEKHDDRVVAFATRLGSGRHEFSYLVRATTAGTFSAAGTRVEAMYAPELTGRSAAMTVTVR